jgi:pimeloyl-ACP methyl ester carboxylesterase
LGEGARSTVFWSNKPLENIDGSFHLIMLDQPDLFAAQVDEFLK